MKPYARVAVSIAGQPERVLETAVAFLVVNEDGRYIIGSLMDSAEEWATFLRTAAQDVEREIPPEPHAPR